MGAGIKRITILNKFAHTARIAAQPLVQLLPGRAAIITTKDTIKARADIEGALAPFDGGIEFTNGTVLTEQGFEALHLFPLDPAIAATEEKTKTTITRKD